MPEVAVIDDVLRALRRGPATLDALAARLGGAERDVIAWAVEDAEQRGLVANSATDCGPDGLCGTNAPAVLTLTDAGRSASVGG